MTRSLALKEAQKRYRATHKPSINAKCRESNRERNYYKNWEWEIYLLFRKTFE